MEDFVDKMNEKKALDIFQALQGYRTKCIQIWDVQGIYSWTKYYILAKFTSLTTLRSASKHIQKQWSVTPKQQAKQRWLSEPSPWISLDLGDIVIHLLMSQAWDYYQLSETLEKAKLIQEFQEQQ